jgi:amino acid permease
MRLKQKINKKMVLDTTVYVASNTFILCILFVVLKEFAELLMNDIIVRHYMCGFLIITLLVISIINIESYHKKYLKNDSNTSKRQNDFFFEEDIQEGERRYFNR